MDGPLLQVNFARQNFATFQNFCNRCKILPKPNNRNVKSLSVAYFHLSRLKLLLSECNVILFNVTKNHVIIAHVSMQVERVRIFLTVINRGGQ